MQILSDSLFQYTSNHDQFDTFIVFTFIVFIVSFNAPKNLSPWPSVLRRPVRKQRVASSIPGGKMYFHFKFFHNNSRVVPASILDVQRQVCGTPDVF